VDEGATVTLGLAPLSGPVALWLRVARFVSRPLFDFAGVRAFRQRLRPARWQSVWLFYPESEGPAMHVVESLRAFAGGSFFAFGVRSIVWQPGGPPWALAIPLVPWTVWLFGLALTGHASLVGFSSKALTAWAVFDGFLVILLFLGALRPNRSRLALAAAAASLDAGLSVPHLVLGGLGPNVAAGIMRSLAAAAPCFGALILGWLVLRAAPRGR
jgi:hypothetical protein